MSSNKSSCTTADDVPEVTDLFGDKSSTPATARLDILQPLFHRAMRLNLPPSAFDDTECPVLRQSPSGSPCTAKSSTGSMCSSPPAEGIGESRALRQGSEGTLVAHSSITSTTNREAVERSNPWSPELHQPCKQDVQVAEVVTHMSGTEHLPVVDLAAALVVISDDPLLSTGAYLPAAATAPRPTTPTTPATPCSVINLSTTTSASMQASPSPVATTVAAFCTATQKGEVTPTAEADKAPVMVPEADTDQSTDNSTDQETQEVPQASRIHPTQSVKGPSVDHAAAVTNSALESSCTASEVGSSAVNTTNEGTAMYMTYTSNSDAKCVSAHGDCSSVQESLQKISLDGQHTDKDCVSALSASIAPTIEHPEPSTRPEKASVDPTTSEATISYPMDYISLPASPSHCVSSSTAFAAAAQSAPVDTAAEDSNTQQHTDNKPCSNLETSTPTQQYAPTDAEPGHIQTIRGSEALSGTSNAPQRFQRHIWRPPKLPVPRVPNSSSVSDSGMQPESANSIVAPSPIAPVDSGAQSISRSNNNSAESSPRTCGDPPSASSSAALPVIHRTTSTGSAVSSSYAASCATITPCSWLPHSQPHSRKSSSTTVSPVVDVSGSLAHPKQVQQSFHAACVSLDTLTLTPTPSPLLPVSGVPDPLLASDSAQELKSTVPIAPPVTPDQSGGSFFHLPDSHSNSGALSCSLSEEAACDSAALARLLSPAAVECSSSTEYAADTSGQEDDAAPFVSPFRHAPSWSTSATMNIPRYPLSKLATIPVSCQPPTTISNSAEPHFDVSDNNSMSFMEALQTPISMGEYWATTSFFPQVHTPIRLCDDPNSPVSTRDNSSPGSSVSVSSPQFWTASPDSPDTIRSVSSPRSPLELSEPSLMQDGYLHVSARHVDWDVSSPHLSEAPSTPFSNISIGTPSSCSSRIGHACMLSPRSERSNGSPVAKALEYLSSPLRYTDSDDSAGGAEAESPPTPADMAALARVNTPFTGNVCHAVDTTAQLASALQVQNDATLQQDDRTMSNALRQSGNAQQVPTPECEPSTTATASHDVSAVPRSSQTPLLDSISDEFDLADAKLNRGQVWAQRRELPISRPQTLSDSPPPSPAIQNIDAQSGLKASTLPSPVPEPFVHSVQHRKSHSLPDSSNLDSVEFTNCSGLLNVADEVAAAEKLLQSVDQDSSDMMTTSSSQPAVTCRVTVTSTRANRKVLGAVPQAGSKHRGMYSSELSTELFGTTDSSSLNSRALLLNSAPASDQPHWKNAADRAAVAVGTRRFGRQWSAKKNRCPSAGSDTENSTRQTRWSPAVAFSRTISSSPGVYEEDGSTRKGSGRLSRLTRRARGASAPTWLSRAWGASSSEKQSTATINSTSILSCCNNDGTQMSKVASKSVPSSWDSSKGERNRLSRPSVQALPSKAEGFMPRRKISFRPELLQYMSNRASSFLCGAGVQEPKFEC